MDGLAHTQDHVKRQTVNKIYPYGTMGHALRWYLNSEMDNSSDNLKSASINKGDVPGADGDAPAWL